MSASETARATDDLEPDGFGNKIAELRPRQAASQRLEPRELNVMRLLARGFEVKEIADALGVSVSVVRNDTKYVRLKLHARNTIHAVALLIKKGAV